MPESDSNPSSGHTGTGISTINSASTTPFLMDLIHRFFIPSIFTIVTAIVLTASLYSNDLDNPAASVEQDQGDEHASNDEKKAVAASDVNDRPVDFIESRSILRTADTSTAAKTSANAPSVDQQGFYRGRDSKHEYPYGQSIPDARQEFYPPVYSEIREPRRLANRTAAKAREQHWQQIRANRAAVLKRIEQNRENMYRRRQEIEQQRLKRTNDRLKRLEQNGKLAGYHPL